MTQGSDTDALQRDRIIIKAPKRPGPKPKPKKMTIAKFEKLLRK